LDLGSDYFKSVDDGEFLGAGGFAAAALGASAEVVIFEFESPVYSHTFDCFFEAGAEGMLVVDIHQLRDGDTFGAVVAVAAAGAEFVEAFVEIVADLFYFVGRDGFEAIDG